MQLRCLKVGAIIPVSDMAASRAFYEGTLGLDGEPAPGGYALRAGGATRIYLLDVASYAGQAGWPLASFQTDDLAATVADLVGRGVQLEVMGDGDPYRTDQHGIADLGDMLIAWFRDPDGQVLSVFQLTRPDRTRPAATPATHLAISQSAERASAGGAIDGANVRWNCPHKEYSMKLLLTSAGIKNPSIHDALVDLLGKPIADCNALCIPTAGYGHPQGSPGGAWRFITGQATTPMCELGWKSLGVLELTALPSIDNDRWVSWVQETDVLLVNGGDALYLCHWMRQSGLVDLLPSLRAVWVGLSGGSMVMTPRIGEDFVGWKPPAGGDSTLGVVDFSIFPHLDHELLPENAMADAERWAAGIPGPAYAIDDETAIKVVDGTVDVISEGHWKLFTR